MTEIKQFGVESNADTVGKAVAGTVGAAIAAHAAVTALVRARQKAGERKNPAIPRGEK